MKQRTLPKKIKKETNDQRAESSESLADTVVVSPPTPILTSNLGQAVEKENNEEDEKENEESKTSADSESSPTHIEGKPFILDDSENVETLLESLLQQLSSSWLPAFTRYQTIIKIMKNPGAYDLTDIRFRNPFTREIVEATNRLQSNGFTIEDPNYLFIETALAFCKKYKIKLSSQDWINTWNKIKSTKAEVLDHSNKKLMQYRAEFIEKLQLFNQEAKAVAHIATTQHMIARMLRETNEAPENESDEEGNEKKYTPKEVYHLCDIQNPSLMSINGSDDALEVHIAYKKKGI